MSMTRAISIIFIFAVVISCSSKTKEENALQSSGKGSIQNIGETFVEKKPDEQKTNQKKDMVKITAYLSNDEIHEDRDFYFPADTERLAIGGMPLEVSDIRGLEQLKNVKKIALYAIDWKFSDVIDSIKIFGDSLEEIILLSCNLSNLDFVQSFPNLRVILFSHTRIDSTAQFDFRVNEKLEYFYLWFTTMRIIRDKLTDQVIDVDKLTIEEKESITLRISPSPVMKMILIDTNEYPIIIDEETMKPLNNVTKVAILGMSFKKGKNDYSMLKKYDNLEIYEDTWNPPDKIFPFNYQLNELRKYPDKYANITD